MTNIAFIPARGGSKSIPLKNIKTINGNPLIYWSLYPLQESKSIERIVVATDRKEIEDEVLSFGFDKVEIFHRFSENAQDHSSTEDVILEYFETANLSDEDLFFLVQATNPFIQKIDIDNALEQFKSGHYDSLLTCARTKRFYWNEDGSPINYDYKNRPRRQDFQGTLIENGAFYISSVKSIRQSKNRLSGKIGIYQMPEHTMLEIDEPEDWVLAELLIQKELLITSKSPLPIKLFLSDIDGVLTDAGMYYTELGDEMKKFSTYDGIGFKLLQNKGIKTGVVTAEDRDLNRRRVQKLNLDYDFHGIENKLEIVTQLCSELSIELSNVAYIGDDINDFELLNAVGLAACPKNARPEIKAINGITVINENGGNGAVREFSELIIKSI